MDGKVSVRDVTTIQLELVGRINFNALQQKAADSDGSGIIDIDDVTNIQLFIVNLINKLPADTRQLLSGKKGKYSTAANKDDAKTYLDTYYSFASYDQYQALKKLHKNNGTSDQLDSAIASLREIAEHIGAPQVFDLRNIYYFENTYDWANVYAYAWTGSSNNGSWPGVKMQKVGTNYGHDVYGIKFDYAGQFKNMIFNSGQGGSQTVDITLENQEHNCFYISGTESDGKCKVENFNYNSSVEPTLPTNPEQNVEENKHYLLLFYQSGVHGWDNKDMYFNYESNTYTLDYTTVSANNISLSLYDNKKSKYKSLTASAEMNFSAGNSQSFTLTDVSSRGKSISIKNLSVGSKLRFTFNPDTNAVTISCIE